MAKAKLNQVVAVNQAKKTRATKTLEELHRVNRDLFAGLSRTYAPKDDDGDKLPAEMKTVQARVPDLLARASQSVIDFHDVVATQETGNTHAKADVVINGQPLLRDVPLTVLLFLEKQATDFITIVRKLPTLPNDREWKWDSNRNCYVTDPEETTRTQKVPKTHIKYEATKDHPAQTEMYHEDKIVGLWTVRHFSGAIKAEVKAEMLRRAEELQDALKRAREEANSVEVDSIKMGKTIWDHVFGDAKEMK